MWITDEGLQQIGDTREINSSPAEFRQVHKDDGKGEREDEGSLGAASKRANRADGSKRRTLEADDQRDNRHLEDEEQDGRAAEGI